MKSTAADAVSLSPGLWIMACVRQRLGREMNLCGCGSGETETAIGGASYFAIGDAAADCSAEIAFTVEEDYQGIGIAGCLHQPLEGRGARRIAVRKPE